MRPFVLIGLLGAFAGSLVAQSSLTAPEVEKLASTLSDWTKTAKEARDPEDKKVQKAREKFLGEYERVVAAHGDGDSVLAMASAWGDVFRQAGAAAKPKSVDGKGRSRRLTVSGTWNNKEVSYEYALLVPKDYTPSTAWPLIIALHDRGNDGPGYLESVWEKPDLTDEGKKAYEELRQKFIVLAPTVGERTEGKAQTAQRIEWMDDFHLWAIFWPLRETLATLNIDTDRVYIEGTGYGGATALQFGMLLSKQFAGICARNGASKQLDLLPNLQTTPTAIFGTSAWLSTDAARELKGRVEETARSGVPIALHERPATTKRLRQTGMDPILEATPEIASFFLDKVRNPFPKKIHFTTDHDRFAQASWIWLSRLDLDPRKGIYPVVEATVDPAENQITILAKNVEGLKVHVCDRLVDLSRPVKVLVNGKLCAEQKFDRSLDALLAWHRQNPFDPTMVVLGTFDLKVPLPVPADGPKDDAKPEGEPPGGSARDGR